MWSEQAATTTSGRDGVRVFERRCYVRAPFHAITGFTCDDGLEAVYWARSQDLSAGGISLCHHVSAKVGADVTIKMPLASGGYLPPSPARIINTEPISGSLWRTGCQFHTPLTVSELHSILGPD
jgi:hypothetical protein